MGNQQEFKTKYVKEGLSTSLLSQNEYLTKYITDMRLFLKTLNKSVAEQSKLTGITEWKIPILEGLYKTLTTDMNSYRWVLY